MEFFPRIPFPPELYDPITIILLGAIIGLIIGVAIVLAKMVSKKGKHKVKELEMPRTQEIEYSKVPLSEPSGDLLVKEESETKEPEPTPEMSLPSEATEISPTIDELLASLESEIKSKPEEKALEKPEFKPVEKHAEKAMEKPKEVIEKEEPEVHAVSQAEVESIIPERVIEPKEEVKIEPISAETKFEEESLPIKPEIKPTYTTGLVSPATLRMVEDLTDGEISYLNRKKEELNMMLKTIEEDYKNGYLGESLKNALNEILLNNIKIIEKVIKRAKLKSLERKKKELEVDYMRRLKELEAKLEALKREEGL